RPVPSRQSIVAHRQQGRTPAPVAATGAETDRLAFDDRDPQRGVGREEVPGGPEARQPAPDDGDVDVDVTAERHTGRPFGSGEGVGPEGSAGRVVHSPTLRGPACTPRPACTP